MATLTRLLRISLSHPSVSELSSPFARRISDMRRGVAGANISTEASPVNETFGIGKQGSTRSFDTKTKYGSENHEHNATSDGEKDEQSGFGGTAETLFGRVKESVSSASPKVFMAFHRLKDVNVTSFAKKGYGILKDELSGKPSKKRYLEYAPFPSMGERSTRTDITVVQTKQSQWSKKLDDLKEKFYLDSNSSYVQTCQGGL